MLPVDLQDPPELIPLFLELWSEGNLVVAGARYEREENWLLASLDAIVESLIQKNDDSKWKTKIVNTIDELNQLRLKTQK